MTGWRSIAEGPTEVTEVARYARAPEVGCHRGLCYTLGDGRWVVIAFTNPRGEANSYFILPEPPR